MLGGLINMVSYVSEDLYLTGAPQITFYRMVYRRYTNFAMESVYLNFDDDIKFDEESELIPTRVGDLMHKAYLHISIPNIAVTKNDVGIDTSILQYVYIDKNIVSDYEKIKNVYMKVMGDIYRIVYKAVNASNVTYSGLIKDVYNYVVNTPGIQDKLNAYDALLLMNRESLQAKNNPKEYLLDSHRSNLWHIITHINMSKLLAYAQHNIDPEIFEINSEPYLKEVQRIMKVLVFKEVERAFSFCKDIQNYFFEEYKNFLQRVENDKSQNIKCAWVKKLGHSIIDYIDVYIGGIKIDHHLGIWINLWYQLTYRYDQIDIYNDMIGNVDVLTHFDRQEKPAYDIYVPLIFWFNKFNGLSFPLIAMQYNDLRFLLKLRKFEEVFYIEKIYSALLNGSNVILTADMIDFIQNRSENKANISLTDIEEVRDISLADIWENKGKMLHGHIMMDYIYLESPERKRFAQSGHEYLIERMEEDIFDEIDRTELDLRLDFTNPSKEIAWVFNRDCNTHNPYGYTECKWYDHSLFFGKGNPAHTSRLTLNGYTRFQAHAGIYFNKYQPYMFHHVTPSDGINIYSFSLDPVQQQPTGACNFTRIDDIRLFINLDDMYFRYTDAQLYPHDFDINFKINLNDPEALLEQIDIDYAKRLVREYKLISADATLANRSLERITTKEMFKRYEDANITLLVYNQLASGDTIELYIDTYRRLLLKSRVKCHIFNLTMNVLRLISGYGSLAFSGNV